MEIAAVYALRSAPHVPLSDACLEIIRRMRLSPVAYRPSAHAHKKSYRKHTPPAARLPDNWRQSVLLETHRRMREREDPEERLHSPEGVRLPILRRHLRHPRHLQESPARSVATHGGPDGLSGESYVGK